MVKARDVHWHDQGPDTVIYEPGPRSLEFTTINFGRGKDNTQVVAWAIKICILLNDAIVQHRDEFGLDGFYFFSQGAEPLLQGRPTADQFQAYGPHIYFAQFTLSAEDRYAWEKTDLQGKLELSSLFWKHEALSDTHPVLPIWLPVMPSEGILSLPPGLTTIFSHSGEGRKEAITSAITGMVEGKLYVADADKFRARCGKGTLGRLRYDLKKGGNTQWLRKRCFDRGSDQVLAFITKTHQLCETHPEWMMFYGKARLRGAMVEFERYVGSRSKLPQQVREEDQEGTDGRRST